MSNSEDEDDYMSDAFLTKAIPEDVRPGLVHDHKVSRKYEMDAKKARFDAEHRSKYLPTPQLESQRREEGLSVALTSNNKGFAMLAKMGYKQGESIGRSSSGIVEPISIQVKNDRGGLGRETAIKQLEEYKAKLRLARSQKQSEQNPTLTVDEFRQRMSQKNNNKLLESDLCKCQRACEKLDLDESIKEPAMKWFWPERIANECSNPQEDPCSDHSESSEQEKSESSDSCCKSHDSDDEDNLHEHNDDSDESCSSEDHYGRAYIVELKENKQSEEESCSKEKPPEKDKQTTQKDSKAADDSETKDKEDEIEYELSEKLEMLTNYLQTTYCYCHWCGVHYKDADDLNDNCPGKTKDEH